MMRASSIIALAAVATAMPLSANAENAYTLRDVQVFTGPGSEYPPVASLPPNVGVDVAGCLTDWSWCDVSFADQRGWVCAGDLGYPYENNRVAIIEYGPRLRLPVVNFSINSYWDAHYRDRPWYRERDVWVNRVHGQVDHGGRPPEVRAARAGASSGGVATQPQAPSPPQSPPAQQAPSPQAGPSPQTTQPRQSPEAIQRPSQPPTSQPQQSQMSPPQGAAPAQSPQTMQTPQAGSSLHSGRPPESRPPENRPPESRPPENRPPESRPPENRPPESRPPENRPPEARGPESGSSTGGPPADRPPEARPPSAQGPRDAGPPSDRGPREGQGAQGRGGDNSPDRGPDRDRQ